MSWSAEWGGRATDFIPDLLTVTGKPGPVTTAAKFAAYEALQSIGEKNPGAWVRLTTNGWEDKDLPGSGHFSLTVTVLGSEPSEVEQQIEAQKPIDLRAAAQSPAPDEQPVEPGPVRTREEG